MVTSLGGLLGLATQTPIGAAIDEIRFKRGAIVLGLVVLAVGPVIVFALPSFWPVIIANGLMAIVGDVFGPAVAALTLGLYAWNQNRLKRDPGRPAWPTTNAVPASHEGTAGNTMQQQNPSEAHLA
ncbi:MAG: hypothetical protein WB697_10440 [Stellaceae bacterium]